MSSVRQGWIFLRPSRSCSNVEINSKVWKTRAFHWFNPIQTIYLLLFRISKCRELYVCVIFCLISCGCGQISILPIDCYFTQIVSSDSFCCSSNKDVVSVSSDVIFSPESRWFDCVASLGSSCPRLDRHITPKRRSNGFPDHIYTEQILCYVFER